MLRFEELVPDLFMLKTPFASLWSGVFLLRGDENILVDSGAGRETVDDIIIPALDELEIELSSIKWIINTHTHGDHAFGNPRLLEVTGAKLATFDLGVDKLKNPLFYSRETRAKFPENSPKAPDYIEPVDTDLVVHDGMILANRVKVFATPGHDTECISLLDLKTNSLLTGDSLQFGGTRSNAGSDIAYYKDLAAYRESIERIRAIGAENLFASHDYQPAGFAFFGRKEVELALDICKDIVDTYTLWVKEQLENGVEDLAELARVLLHKGGGVEGAYLFTDMYTAYEHLMEARREIGEGC